MIDLYLAPTANGLRAAVALEEAGLSYRAHMVDLAKGERRSPEFLKLNPAGLIPVIVDDDGPGGNPLTLSQSGRNRAVRRREKRKAASRATRPGALSPCNG